MRHSFAAARARSSASRRRAPLTAFSAASARPSCRGWTMRSSASSFTAKPCPPSAAVPRRRIKMDITRLIMDDHDEQRRLFAMLDQIEASDTRSLEAIWSRLSAFLEIHAEAEEQIFYPAL